MADMSAVQMAVQLANEQAESLGGERVVLKAAWTVWRSAPGVADMMEYLWA